MPARRSDSLGIIDAAKYDRALCTRAKTNAARALGGFIDDECSKTFSVRVEKYIS